MRGPEARVPDVSPARKGWVRITQMSSAVGAALFAILLAVCRAYGAPSQLPTITQPFRAGLTFGIRASGPGSLYSRYLLHVELLCTPPGYIANTRASSACLLLPQTFTLFIGGNYG
ncbi:MAG: hypothetical protein ACJ71Q_15715 [Terriglobales bacterium]